MNRFRSFLHALSCLIRNDGDVFPGDDFTRWLEHKAEEAEQSAARLRQSRDAYEKGNLIEDAILGRTRPGRNHQ